MLQLSFTSFKKGSYIVVEGKIKTDCFYIIQSGNVRVHHEINIPRLKAEVLGPGDFINVISCMSGQTNVDSAIAISDVVCITVQKSQFPELIQKNTPVALKIIRSFAKKMRETNEAIMAQAADSVAEADPNQIFKVAAYYDEDLQGDIALFAYYQYLKEQPNGSHAKQAKFRIAKLKQDTNAVYLDPTPDPVRSYPKGTMIFSEAQKGAEMFIIQSGMVKISKIVKEGSNDDGREVTFSILKKGDMFGEMALLENKPRSASAIAASDCKLMVVNTKNFNQMVSSQPQMIASLTTTFAMRLWPMYRQLVNTLIQDPVSRMLDMLQLQLEKNKIGPDAGNNYETNYTAADIAQMCGMSKHDQASSMYKFMMSSFIKIERDKIFIPSVDELYKQSIMFRKKLARQQSNELL